MGAEAERLVERALERLRSVASGVNCAIACVSGGVDSTVAALLARMVLGDRLYPVFIDTGFMRKGEASMVAKALENTMKVEVHDFSERFISALEGVSDAEEKRLRFRDLFYSAVREVAQSKGCGWVVQGTIRADVVETVGGVKTQHNVLSEELMRRYGIEVVEPLAELYKHEVRSIASALGLPLQLTKRQPFPGPGLLIRAVGRLTREKLELVRGLTDIVETALEKRGYSQYFPAVWEYEVIEKVMASDLEYDVFGVKVTGVVEGRRAYGSPVLVRRLPEGVEHHELYKVFDPVRHPHVLVPLAEAESGRYVAVLRVVITEDFMSAEVPKMDSRTLRPLAEELLSQPGVRLVAFDVSPKPPATIEFE